MKYGHHYDHNNIAPDYKKEAAVKPWLRHRDARVKTIAVLIFITGVIYLENIWLLLSAFFFVLITALMTGVSYRILLLRLSLLIPFLLMLSIPLIFGGGWPPPPDRLFFALGISLKGVTSMTALVILMITQPIDEYLAGLAGLKVPPVVISVISLSYRYVYLFAEDLKTMQKALSSRLFKGGLSKRKLAVYGELSGAMLVKSFDRSEQVYKAMVSRCFNGNIYNSCSAKNIDMRDIFILVIPGLFVIILIALELTLI